MTGNAVSTPPEPLFLLDESLSPAVAKALNLVDYNFVDVRLAIRPQGVKDPEIIQWCQENMAIWVHADDRANRKHKKLLQTSGIRTLWLLRPGGVMSRKEQLRILSSALPTLFEKWEQNPGVRHYQASADEPTAAPSVTPITI